MIERKTTSVQWMDGYDDPAPHPPPGDGWRLTHVAAASGRLAELPPRSSSMPLCALLFFIWEREVPDATSR